MIILPVQYFVFSARSSGQWVSSTPRHREVPDKMGSAIPEGKESTSMLQQYTEWDPAYVTSAFHPAVEHDKTELLFFRRPP